MSQDLTKQFEGYSPTIYKDSEGKSTVGYGFNLEDPTVSAFIPADVVSGKRPILKEEADEIFDLFYDRAMNDARNSIGPETFDALSDTRKSIMTDMSYNLGKTKFSGFKEMKKAIEAKDYQKAKAEMINSKWYNQVGNRSKKLTEMMVADESV